MSVIKHSSKHTIVFILLISIILTTGCLFRFSGYAQGKEIKLAQASAEETERTLLEWKARLEKDNKLYSYAVKKFKSPIKHHGKIDIEFGEKYGYFQFIFSGGNEFIVETEPPETKIFRLRVINGFTDNKEVLKVLQQCVHIHKMNWQKPIEKFNGDERIVKYESNEDGDNTAATMVYKKNKLVEIEYHLM